MMISVRYLWTAKHGYIKITRGVINAIIKEREEGTENSKDEQTEAGHDSFQDSHIHIHLLIASYSSGVSRLNFVCGQGPGLTAYSTCNHYTQRKENESVIQVALSLNDRLQKTDMPFLFE